MPRYQNWIRMLECLQLNFSNEASLILMANLPWPAFNWRMNMKLRSTTISFLSILKFQCGPGKGFVRCLWYFQQFWCIQSSINFPVLTSTICGFPQNLDKCQWLLSKILRSYCQHQIFWIINQPFNPEYWLKAAIHENNWLWNCVQYSNLSYA